MSFASASGSRSEHTARRVRIPADPPGRELSASASRRTATAALLALCVALLPVGRSASAGAFLSKAEALDLAFPDAERVEARSFVLTDAQAEALERDVGALESRLLTLHVGHAQDRVLGYALIDVHTVRTQPEALMVVLAPEGTVRSVRVLAFYEPMEYLPGDRFRDQFAGRTLGPGLRIGGDIDAVAGATLSARATARSVRLALAAFTELIQDADAAPVGGGAPSGEPAPEEPASGAPRDPEAE